ncbi:hypothetical protein LJC15_03225 [Desulfovibrio sp. OttesenSCG-928-G11]|nr:hypothetical protein [Desulfovibrio sp. OttesenSCG-928-G11]
MKTATRLLWWAMYIAGALMVQQSVPGVDALTPGFLLSLQERRHKQTFWLFVLFVLIQEGTGSLNFGSALLWYGGQVALFYASLRFFVADSLLFVLMLAGSLGIYHGFIAWFMGAVQMVPLDFFAVLRESLIQAAIIPLIWGLAFRSRPKGYFRNV